MTSEVVIASAVRTPIGTFGGSLADVPATDLAATAIREALKRGRVAPEQVDEVLLGNVLSAGLGMNPARIASLAAGIPVEVPATSVNKACGSSLKTVALAAQAIMLGDAEIIVAAGTESMSRAPYLMMGARWGYRMNHQTVFDHMLTDGLWCSLSDCHMGITAENLVEMYEIPRQEQDRFAYESHMKAARAWEQGVFKEEVVPVEVPQRRGPPKVVDKDEHFRPDTSLDRLGQLQPAFKQGGTVTAGNASGINDGAAATVIMSLKKAEELGVQPLAAVRAYASAGVEPHIMGIGPAPAVRKALARAGLELREIDLIELNEAFAGQSLAVGLELRWDWERVNVNGGAVALGHPVGASGARILTTLLYEMRRRQVKRGLAALCIGGGQGIAMVVERIG